MNTQKLLKNHKKLITKTTMFSTLQLKNREHSNDGRKHKRIGSYTMAETEGRKFKTDWIRMSIGYGKKYAIIKLELLAVVWGLEHFQLYI